MASFNYEDLIPRPLPKPTQIEVSSVKPVVPDVSLVFDSLAPNRQDTQSTSMNSRPFNTNAEVYFSNRDYEMSKAPYNSTNYVQFASAYPPPLSEKQPELYYGPKTVSFSPQVGNNESIPSQSPLYRVPDNTNHPQNKPELSGCCCGLDLETDMLNSPKYVAQPSFSQRRDLNFNGRNEISPKQCVCINGPKEVHEMSHRDRKENISPDEFQKTVLQFENMFLKLNYKFSKISENCVTREELNTITQKYENQIGVLMQRIHDLTLKLNRENCEQSRKLSDQSDRLDSVKIRLNEKQNCIDEWGEDSSGRRSASIEAVSLAPDGTSSKNREHGCCSRSNDEYDESKESREHRIVREQYEPVELRPNDVSQCRDRQLNERQYFVGAGEHRTNARSSASTPTSAEPNRNENETKKFELVEPAEQRELNSKTSEECQQLKRMYNNIVHDVKNMIDRSPHGTDVNSINFIRKATLDQFRKMGVNVEDLEEEARYPPKDNVNINRKFVNPNGVAPSDLSLHMHTLAMKYISNGQLDNENQLDRKTPANDVSIRSNHNNRSIATLEYMERYHLLSAPDQYSSKSSAYMLENSSNPKCKPYEHYENNDRSFLR